MSESRVTLSPASAVLLARAFAGALNLRNYVNCTKIRGGWKSEGHKGLLSGKFEYKIIVALRGYILPRIKQ